MPANYVGDPTTATTTLSLMTAGDRRTAQIFRVPLERLLDNDAALRRDVWEAGDDIADGATISIPTAGHAFNLITSTTAITAFSFTGSPEGRSVLVRFDTARTLTHNASTLIIPGGANITTAQGDVMQITRTTTGVRVDWYTRAAVVPGASASDTVEGVLELATQAETNALSDTTRAVVPGRLPLTGDAQQGLIEIATQAEQETGTDTTRAVTPGRQHFHPSAAKFWAHVSVSAGVPTLEASYNVSGIVDSATGELTVNIGTDFSGAHWACMCTVESVATALVSRVTTRNAQSVTVVCVNMASAQVDPSRWNVMGFGDHS